jgi:membrane peptidoglycan carboxypeptidase
MRKWLLIAALVCSIATACGSSTRSALITDSAGDALALDKPTMAAAQARIAAELPLVSDLDASILHDPSYRIITTLDRTIQIAVDTSITKVPSTAGRFVPAVLVLSPRTGEILAIRSTARDVLKTRRGSGSTMKLVELLAASRAGIGPTAELDGRANCRFDTPQGLYDATAGAEVLGAAPLWKMTALSINCAFAKLAQVVGEAALARAVADLGIAPVSDLGPRFAVGYNTVTPEELVSAMAALLGDGSVLPRRMIARVEHNGSPVALRELAKPKITVEPQTRLDVLTSLRAVLETGTARASHLTDGRPAAGKTGTQPNNTDAWFVGGTPSVAAVVWLGNPADPADGMTNVREFGRDRIRGATIPAPVWQEIIEATVKGTAQEPMPEVPAV